MREMGKREKEKEKWKNIFPPLCERENGETLFHMCVEERERERDEERGEREYRVEEEEERKKNYM